jgi:hypothetical protein
MLNYGKKKIKFFSPVPVTHGGYQEGTHWVSWGGPLPPPPKKKKKKKKRKDIS